MIKAESVSRFYGAESHRVTAVRNLSMTVDAGERVSIIGRSGSGKSTLLNLLAGLDRPSEGVLAVDDCELHKLTRHEMAQYRLNTVGIIFQAFQLIPQRNALQNVELPLIMAGVTKRGRRPRAEEWLRRVGLEHRSTHFPYELSGGEQQRVAIARALVNTPRVLLADEPTGNLDSSNAVSIMDLLMRVRRESGSTLILITHDEELAGQYTDRIIRLADGRLISDSKKIDQQNQAPAISWSPGEREQT